MAEALMISKADITKYTALDGNIDPDKFVQWVKVAQDIHIQTFLGTDLFNKIKADIVATTLTGAYQTLVETYVKPTLIHFAMCEFLPFMAYSLTNKGVYKKTAENSESVQKNEVDYLVEKEKVIANHYAQRMIDYITYNISSFPEYNTNTNGDIQPLKKTFNTNWNLGGSSNIINNNDFLWRIAKK
jgi:hypothetical protein